MSMPVTETSDNKRKGSVVLLLCVECSNYTKHEVVSSCDVVGDVESPEEDYSAHWEESYQIVRCRGCENISFRHWEKYSGTETEPTDDGITERLYPQRDIGALRAHLLLNTPIPLRRIYGESISAYNSDCLILCAAGLRALVEGICADQKIKDGQVEKRKSDGTVKIIRTSTLDGKIAGLAEKGVLTTDAAMILHTHRYLGNEAVHQLDRPSKQELQLATEIVEHVLEQLYEIPYKATQLKQRFGNRKAKV